MGRQGYTADGVFYEEENGERSLYQMKPSCVIEEMLRLALLFFAFIFSFSAFAQCDTAEVRAWLRTMNYDTVQLGTYRWKCGKQSFITFTNDSNFSYRYQDSITYDYSYRYYVDYYLRSWDYNKSDTFIKISYYWESCQPMYYITEVHNDSLTTSEEGGTVYDYYREIVYNEDGKKDREYLKTVVYRRGKRMCKSVYVNYTGIIDKRKVRYYEQTKGNN